MQFYANSEKNKRKMSRGGDLEMVYRSSFKPYLCSTKSYDSFEYKKVEMKIGFKDTYLYMVYRPHFVSKSVFLQVFYKLC